MALKPADYREIVGRLNLSSPVYHKFLRGAQLFKFNTLFNSIVPGPYETMKQGDLRKQLQYFLNPGYKNASELYNYIVSLSRDVRRSGLWLCVG